MQSTASNCFDWSDCFTHSINRGKSLALTCVLAETAVVGFVLVSVSLRRDILTVTCEMSLFVIDDMIDSVCVEGV